MDCKNLYDDERWQYFLSFSRIKQILDKGEDIVCPDVDHIDVQNEHGDTIFSYFLINIVQCDYTVEDNDCITDDQTDQNPDITIYKLRTIVDFTINDESDAFILPSVQTTITTIGEDRTQI